jgi:hypothetical protein
VARKKIGAESPPESEIGQAPVAGASQPIAPEDRAASEVILPAGPENRPALATELLRAEAGDVAAETVAMERAGAEHVTANRVVMTNSGARTVDARSAQVDRSGILAVHSEKAVFSNSSIIAAATEQARFVRSRVLLMKTDDATLDGETKVGVYLGPATENLRPLIDARGAAALGAGIGVALVLLGAVLRRMLPVR